jgi:succinate dehydrogenase/fumarate reductase flavoprotein subunit
MSNETTSGFTRRDFMKVAGIGAAALAIPSMGLCTNTGQTAIDGIAHENIETDVLVIGGGYAGVYAAIQARKSGATVTIVEKGTIFKSGLSPFARGVSYFDKDVQDPEVLKKYVQMIGEYLARDAYLDIYAEKSKGIIEELKSWGFFESGPEFTNIMRQKVIDSGAKVIERTMITNLIKKNGRVVGAVGFPMEEDKAIVIKAKAVILCAGAGSFKSHGFFANSITSDGDAMAYRIGAEISGKEFQDSHSTPEDYPADSFLGWQGMVDGTNPNTIMVAVENNLTMQEYIYAHTIGAPVARGGGDGVKSLHPTPGGGLEWGGPGGGPEDGGEQGGDSGSRPEGSGEQGGDRPEGGQSGDRPEGGQSGDRPEGGQDGGRPEGDQSGDRPEGGQGDAGPSSEGGRGAGPSSGGARANQVGGASAGLSVHKAEGIFPVDDTCGSAIPGLYAAGDALSSMMFGGTYALSSASTIGGAAQGIVAAKTAAAYAANTKRVKVSEAEISAIKNEIFAARQIEKGYSPDWLLPIVQNIMIPYYVLYVKKQDRLEAALANIMFFQEHFAPKLIAEDTHQLRMVHELKNMLLNAEMKLRASLFRTESRANHYREDYPARDDSKWLAWVVISEKNGKMTLKKVSVPDSNKVDSSLPYAEKYPSRFPNELEFVKANKIS